MGGDVYEQHQQVNELDDAGNPMFVCRICGLVTDGEEPGPCIEGQFMSTNDAAPTPASTDEATVTDEYLDAIDGLSGVLLVTMPGLCKDVRRIISALRAERRERDADARVIMALAGYLTTDELNLCTGLQGTAEAVGAARERVRKL